MRLNVTAIDDLVKEMKAKDASACYISHVHANDGKRYALSIVVEACVGKDEFVRYIRHVGESDTKEDNMNKLAKLAAEDRIEISEFMVESKITMSEGWFE